MTNYSRKEAAMREILFRGNSILNGKWVYGDLEYSRRDVIARIHSYDHDSKAYLGQVVVDPSTVGQYTGLTDKNGIKIFEGDIVHWEYPDTDYDTGAKQWIKVDCEVKFVYGSFRIDSPPYHLGNTLDYDEDDGDWRLEVIGNIYSSERKKKGE